MKVLKTVYIAVSMVWLAVLVVWSGMTLLRCFESPKKRPWSIDAKLPDRIHADMLDGCWHKDELVNINGGWTRFLGKRLCNGVYRLSGAGRLFGDKPARLSDAEVEKRCRAIVGFRDFINQWGGRLLYLQPPYGIDNGNVMLPRGVLTDRVHGNENADRIVDMCRKTGTFVLDLRTFMTATPKDVESSFYMTDHHWRIEAVFAYFPKLLAKMREIGVMNEDYVWDESKWRYVFRPRFFLGYWGRRTGSLFSGLDDFGYYETETGPMSMSVPSSLLFTKGPFNDVIISRKHLLDDTAKANRNAVYTGENAPLAIVRNPSAPVEKKILIMKDSFARPVIAFLSTLFREIHVIDPRHYRSDVSEYAASVRPDCVLICYNPVSVSSRKGSWFDFGRMDSVPDLSRAKKIAEGLEERVSSSMNEWAWKRLPVSLDSKCWHRISFKIDAATDVIGATVRLYDLKQEKYVETATFPNDGADTNHEWVFHTGENPVQIVLYAGVAGRTAGKCVRYSDICVEKFIDIRQPL